MGLAASQARLLTITARLADNELRSQTINNAKMRLATQSAQASNEYVSALNNAQLMFNNTAENGIAQSQALTFNALTQYSQYNNQYGLVNSAGQILVSEADAKMFQDNSNNLEGFLKAHGLEWDTTYFDMKDTDGSQINLAQRLTDFYTGSNQFIGNLFNGMTNNQLKQMYLDSISQEASIEQLNYNILAQNYHKAFSELETNLYTDLRNEIFGGSTSTSSEEAIINAVKNLTSADAVKKEFLEGNIGFNQFLIPDSIDNGAKFSLSYIDKYLTTATHIMLHNQLESLGNVNGMAGLGSEKSDIVKEELGTRTYQYLDYSTGQLREGHYNLGTKYTFGTNPTFTLTVGIDDLVDRTFGSISYQEVVGNHSTIQSSDANYLFDGSNMSSPLNIVGPPINFDLNDPNSVNSILSRITSSAGNTVYKYADIITSSEKQANGTFIDTTSKKVIKITASTNQSELFGEFATAYFDTLFNNMSAIDLYYYANNTNSTASNRISNLSPTGFGDYGISISIPNEADLLLDFDEMVKAKCFNHDASGNITTLKDDYNLSKYYSNTSSLPMNSKFRSVLGVYMTEKMVDVLGEPKYAWVDKSANPTDNPDNKAQWLTNLFNRMQKGYKVLENGLASSSQWLEHAFESGLVTMEQVDMSYNWINMDYKTCSNIYEQTDNSAIVAKAEATYNRAMNDIKQKDSLFDLQLKNIDTEHSALQTEYDVIKGVMSKNIERTMKFDQSA